MFGRFFTLSIILSTALLLNSLYILFRLKKQLPAVLPDDIMVGLLAILGVLSALALLFHNIRRDAVRTLL